MPYMETVVPHECRICGCLTNQFELKNEVYLCSGRCAEAFQDGSPLCPAWPGDRYD
jgi:hypothetical protein